VIDELRTWQLPAADHAFDELLASVRFEEVTGGRRGTVLVRPTERGEVPIVRTTTPYRAPARTFAPIHARLADQIRAVAELPHELDNALIEHYTNTYVRMKRHSDQALDLADGSSIAVYSCYRDPARPSRRLVVTPKLPGGAPFELPLVHGGVVTFSLAANRRFTHAILLREHAPDNEWLGITFRSSKTRVRFVDGAPWIAGQRLTLADEDQRRTLFELRRRENTEIDFEYPAIGYTLSASDLVPPE